MSLNMRHLQGYDCLRQCLSHFGLSGPSSLPMCLMSSNVQTSFALLFIDLAWWLRLVGKQHCYYLCCELGSRAYICCRSLRTPSTWSSLQWMATMSASLPMVKPAPARHSPSTAQITTQVGCLLDEHYMSHRQCIRTLSTAYTACQHYMHSVLSVRVQPYCVPLCSDSDTTNHLYAHTFVTVECDE